MAKIKEIKDENKLTIYCKETKYEGSICIVTDVVGDEPSEEQAKTIINKMLKYIKGPLSIS